MARRNYIVLGLLVSAVIAPGLLAKEKSEDSSEAGNCG